MEWFIQVGQRKFQLTEEQAEKVLGEIGAGARTKLVDVKAGETVWIGPWEFLILDHMEDETVVILKDLLRENVRFGKNNCYDGSEVDAICNKFAEELAGAVGEENLTEFAVDLMSDDGLKDYGVVKRKAALLTTEMYRLFVDALDQQILEKWWWLSTPFSTKRHGDDRCVKCVSPRGYISNDYYFNDLSGVRPFCILKSNIFVSR